MVKKGIIKKSKPVTMKASLKRTEMIKPAQEAEKKRPCSVTVCWKIWELLVLSTCILFMKVDAAVVAEPWPYTPPFLSLPASETHPAQLSFHTHTHKDLPNKSWSIFLWTLNIFSQRGCLVETGSFPYSRWDNEQERVSWRCFKPWFHQSKVHSQAIQCLHKQKCSSLELYFCSLCAGCSQVNTIQSSWQGLTTVRSQYRQQL